MIDYARINNTLGKMRFYLSSHEHVCVSVSGGGDSDLIVHMICTHFRDQLPKIHFVFADTGIEYQATKEHLAYIEQRYGIQIVRVKGTPIPAAVRKYGVPLKSKQVSDYIQRLQKHGFQFEDGTVDALCEKYPGTRAALRWWCNDWGDKSRFNISWNKGLKEKLTGEKLSFRVSAMCCTCSKKRPLADYQKRVNCDLLITGERKSEGGARAGRHLNCFETKSNGLDHYMPLWFWNDETKQYYVEAEKIVHSDCYTVYGLKRTGCVGCPFGRNIADELRVISEHEPKLYKLVWSVFGKAYEYQGIEK